MTKTIFAWIIFAFLTIIEVLLIIGFRTSNTLESSATLGIMLFFFSLFYCIYLGISIYLLWESLPEKRNENT